MLHLIALVIFCIVISSALSSYLYGIIIGVPLYFVLLFLYYYLSEKKKDNTTNVEEISEGENTFIYRDSKGEVSFRHVEVRLLDDDRFHGVDLDINETRTYLYERVLETLPTEKVSKMSEQQIQKLVASYQKNYQVTETKKSNRVMKKEGDFAICFTGFKALEKAELINLAKESGIIVRTKVSHNIDMLVCGESVGPSKLESAKKSGIVITDEEGFRNFLETGEL
jgi:Ca2+/Na+ antiporter